ncbi:MAG: sulfotransferase domain-containing protein [Gammaproteobacteria bacterium]|nr:sulfotransferase domain-containing protein [Gammaproteobacteria bacterium]
MTELPAWRDGDIFLCSYPKSGRTWIKQFLAQYLSLTFNLDYREDYDLIDLMRIVPSEWMLRLHPGGIRLDYFKNPAIPCVRFSHFPFDDTFAGKPVIWLTRGIEDTLVSLWHNDGCPGEIGSFVREKVEDYTNWMMGWIAGIELTSRWLHVTYEGLLEDTWQGFHDIIRFIGLPCEEDNFYIAIRRASFDAMRRDQEGSKVERVRRGIVGGYRDELLPEDVEFIRGAVRAGGDDKLCFYCGVETKEGQHA